MLWRAAFVGGCLRAPNRFWTSEEDGISVEGSPVREGR